MVQMLSLYDSALMSLQPPSMYFFFAASLNDAPQRAPKSLRAALVEISLAKTGLGKIELRGQILVCCSARLFLAPAEPTANSAVFLTDDKPSSSATCHIRQMSGARAHLSYTLCEWYGPSSTSVYMFGWRSYIGSQSH